jgi:AcrR family transcriptional regulator
VTRSFSDEEKRDITDTLLIRGREMFERYGMKKTSIEELTKAAGIAQGSFYLFYDSKEELFFEILDAEERALRERIARMVAELPPDRRGFKQVITRAFQMMRENTIIRQVLVDGEYSRFFNRIRKERLKVHLEEESAFIGTLIGRMQSDGVIRKVKPGVLTGLFFGLFLLGEQRSRIGEEVFDQVIDVLIDSLCDGLITRGEPNISAGNAAYLMEE